MVEPTLTIEMFRGAAGEILEAIARNRRGPDDVYREQWIRLWSLLRLMKSVGPRIQPHDQGPWALKAPDINRPHLGQWLVGGNLWLAVVPPEELQSEDARLVPDLPGILNSAKVEPPDD